MAARKYTEEERAVALAAFAANENNFERTAKFTGIPRNTIRRWVNGEGVNAPTVANATLKKGLLADRLEQMAHLLLGCVPDKLSDASLQMVATSIGIAVDKMQLLRSKPTEIIEDASLTDERRAARIAEILQSARDRRDRQSADAAEGDTAAP